MSYPKMSDVAKHAGVSVTTVSHVINKTRFVGEETKQRVLKAIEALNYTPDFAARSIKTGKTMLIGFVVPDISNSFFSTLIETVGNILSVNGYGLVVLNTNEDKEKEFKTLHFLSTGIIDALIIASTNEDFSEIKNSLPINIPILFVDRQLKQNSYPTVTVSSDNAIEQAVKYLVDCNRKKIGYIAGLKRLSTTNFRLNAFKNALKNNLVGYSEENVKFANSMINSATDLVDELVNAGCDAIMVSNNIMTFDVINQLKQIGSNIPVVGFCDSPLDDRFMGNIAKIVQPSEEMGKLIAEIILKNLENHNCMNTNKSLESSFQKLV